MATSNFFDNFNSYAEQTLLEDLVIESIRIYGHDIHYCPRTLVAKDDIYGEDTISEYNKAYFLEMYIKSFDSYEGDGQFLSKFNLEIRDQMRFVVARRTFNNEVGSIELIERPREGDLIYSPMMKRLFVVMYVNNTATFYQMGSLQTYELTCEVFEYSNEKLNTGIAEIDEIEDNFNFAQSNNATVFDTLNNDIFADNKEFVQENTDDDVVDFTSLNPFSESID